METNTKLEKLKEILLGYDQMLIALSGGVDSVFLLAFACETYGKAGRPDSVAALTATGPQFAGDELEYAKKLCDSLGISHKTVDVSHVINMVKRNPVDRCYHCKRELFGILKERADMVGSVLADGTNLSDMSDYRPGRKALEELGVLSPLKEAGLTKDEIREALHQLPIGDVAEMWDKPAFACLISRIPYGEMVTETKLTAIYEAENYLKGLGFTQLRVRCHEIAGRITGSTARFMARIELLPEEMRKLFAAPSTWVLDGSEVPDETPALTMPEIEKKLKALGFEYVTLDLGGYEKGKMNGDLQKVAKEDLPDRINVTETVIRGNADKVNTADVLAEIDRFLRETQDRKYSFNDFVEIVSRLREPNGCPWDRAQTHESLKKYMVEEVNEALEAIDEGDGDHLCEELGDVLLQIVLHAQIAAESGEFSIDGVVQSVSEKMIRRHPHVFGNIDVSGVDEGLDLWEEIKKREKQNAIHSK